MKFDYSKTINEQLPTFEYYKDRYCSYELELINDRKEIKRLNNIINELEKDIKNLYTYGIKNNAEQRDYLLNRLEELHWKVEE